ncbi:TonB-dependent siderophore receptor [Indioceanicola profundi]|uniref:TonB-dependent siderophore receptor n=1 Tax=Indioceanicola profundi TaxID=2220096 RepID=UPI000E6AC5ED|nr:TonB-dependent siderophore receptor [Indioceanicola profundi]
MSRSVLAVILASTSLAGVPALARPVSPDVLEEIVVTGRTTAVTKTDRSIVEIPQSVSVIDAQELEIRLPQTLNEALGYTPGVNVGSYGFDTRYDAFFIRGFQATYTGVFRDGLRQLNSPSGLYRNEPYGLESLTVVRGPASVLYGASGAGGLVNTVSKRPTDTSFAEIEAIIGNHDRYQLNADVSGPLDASGKLAYRLTGVVRDSDTHLPGYPDNRAFIAPAVSFSPGDNTNVTLLGEYMTSKTGASAAYYNDANGITDIPSGDPRFNDFDHEQWRAGYEAEHRFANGLTLRQNLRYAEVDAELQYAYVTDPTTTPITRGSGVARDRHHSLNIDNQAHAEFDTGFISHDLLIGFDYNRVAYRSAEGFGGVPATGPVPTPALTPTVRQTFDQTGLYAQDQIEAGRLGVVAGIRHDWLDARTRQPLAAEIEQNDNALSGRVGITYDLDIGLVPYVNWSSSFEPNIGLLLDGAPAEPTTAEQVEAGIKFQPAGGRALFTVGVFNIVQKDGVVFDASTGINRQVQLDLRSRGVELEASVRLLEGLDPSAAYAYTDMEIREGAAGTVGNTLSATPKHSGSIRADYMVPDTGFGLGGGIRYFGRSYGNDLNTVRNDDRAFVDAVVHYEVPGVEGLRLQLNATNLFDSEPVTCASGYCYRDQGRTVLGSLRYRL